MDSTATEALLEKRHQQRPGFVKEFGAESKTLWKISGPAIFTYICQYSLGAFTQTFAGQVGELELAAVSVENSVIAGLVFGVMVIFLFVLLCESFLKFLQTIAWTMFCSFGTVFELCYGG